VFDSIIKLHKLTVVRVLHSFSVGGNIKILKLGPCHRE